jgi:putative endonuclease
VTVPIMATRDVGLLWENAALSHLRQSALEMLARNFTCRLGEIDLVMLEKSRLDKGRLDKSGPDKNRHDQIVFVEIRYRNPNARGDGLASVGASKRAKLIRAAAIYLQANPKLAGMPCRFDVVACSGTPDQPSFDWIRAAFDAVE